MEPKPMTRARARLLKLTNPHGAVTKYALKFGVKVNQVSQWRNGTDPTGQNRTRMKRWIPVSWWDEVLSMEEA
jgi:hypothetical protein